MIFDISDFNSFQLTGSLDLPGWQTQEGKSLVVNNEQIMLGRTVGGFNNINNHENFKTHFNCSC